MLFCLLVALQIRVIKMKLFFLHPVQWTRRSIHNFYVKMKLKHKIKIEEKINLIIFVWATL